MRSVIVGVLALLLAGCVDTYVDGPPTLASFSVELVDPEVAGSPDRRLEVPDHQVEVEIRARAWGSDGKPYPWTGRARVMVTPGRTFPGDFPISFEKGVGTAKVTVHGVHSDTRIWVIDDAEGRRSYSVGVSPILHFDQPTLAAINALPPGVNQNTTSFFLSLGNRGDFVRMERVGEVFAPRTSPEDPCRLASPLPSKRDLIVTAIDDQGFYVTDLAEPPHPRRPGNFGHIYVYNFNFPEGLSVGDRLESLEGSIQEFSGHTQLSFPVYRASRCPLVEGDDAGKVQAQEREVLLEALAALEARAPHLDRAICGTGVGALSCGHANSNFDIESLESALVVVEEVQTPDLWVRCDFDGNGQAATYQQRTPTFVCGDETDPECACMRACHLGEVFPPPGAPFEADFADRGFDATGTTCTELTAYETYGQYAVRMVENGQPGPLVNLHTTDAFPDFDPRLEENAGARLRARGILQQVRAARPRWLVQTRIPDERQRPDLCCLDGDACPVGLAACDPN